MAMNSFRGTQMSLANDGISFMIAEIIKIRKQLTCRDAFKAQSGWGDALNALIKEYLESLAQTLSRITYNPEPKTKDELEGDAANTAGSLATEFNEYTLSDDNTVMPNGPDRPVVWQLDGSDPDLPQLDQYNCPNDMARSLITGLDKVFVTLTRLDSRFQAQTITKSESVMVRAMLQNLYTLCKIKGGESNKSDIPTGTLPSQEPDTFDYSGSAS